MISQSQYAVTSNEIRLRSTSDSLIVMFSLLSFRFVWSNLHTAPNLQFNLRHSWFRCLRFIGWLCLDECCLRWCLWWLWLWWWWCLWYVECVLLWWWPMCWLFAWFLPPSLVDAFDDCFLTLLSSSADCCLKITLNSSSFSSSFINRTPASTLSSLWLSFDDVEFAFFVAPSSHSPTCATCSWICSNEYFISKSSFLLLFYYNS